MNTTACVRLYKMTGWLRLFLIAFAVGVPLHEVFGEEVNKPNVILILGDDLGAAELGCYGNKVHRTPNLDQLASEGTRFETFYANPLCTPTRVALMTGLYGYSTGYLGMNNKSFVPPAKSPQRDIGRHFTHADLMKSAGYTTALVGKWQLSGALPHRVFECGFDAYQMWAYDWDLPPGTKHPSHEGENNTGNTSRYWHPCLMENGVYRPTQENDYGPDLHNQFVLDFAKKNRDQPFFVYYTSTLTHGPHLETPDPTIPGKRTPKGFPSNLEYLDHLIGKLVSGLKDLGIYEKTTIVFLGDNGTASRGKGTVTELGARVPCIVRGPGVKAGQVSRAVADITDILPTLASWSGARLPSHIDFPGSSMSKVLSGEEPKHRDWIYSHLDDGRLLRNERWLLQIDKGDLKETFFDCGDCRDGSRYREVTGSSDPEVRAARQSFQEILKRIPVPKPNESKGGE